MQTYIEDGNNVYSIRQAGESSIYELMGQVSKVETVRVNETTVEDVTVTFDLGLGGYVEVSRVTRADSEPLDTIKQRKIDEFVAIESNLLQTFKSSALGTEHTYLSGLTDMLLMTGQYSFVKGSDFDGMDFMWYTVENGNVSHTAAQFIQVYLNARTNVSTVKYHRAALEYQVSVAATAEAVNAIVW